MPRHLDRSNVIGALALAVALILPLGFAQHQSLAQGTPEASPVPGVEAQLIDATGTTIGTATLTEDEQGHVTIAVSLEGLPPGDHGIHVHAVGVCDPMLDQPFTTAGPHYNPAGTMHGGPPTDMQMATPVAEHQVHAGDLGNLTVADDGTASFEITTPLFTLSEGPRSLSDADGSALLIHELPDDFTSQPSGNSGSRIACAVLVAQPEMSGAAGSEALTVENSILVPEQVPFDEGLLESLQLPDEFEISVYAQGLSNPRMMAFGPNGTLYVTETSGNSVVGLRDSDGDGVSDEVISAISNLPLVHGMLFHDGLVYLAGEKMVWSAEIADDGTFGEPTVVLDNLPDGGQHPRRTIAIGPDGMLYISLGSSCNVCIESNPESATIIRANLDGSGRETFATGLRNTIGFFFHPDTGELWGWDQGSDFRGDDQPPEELNHIVGGGNYGWPYCFGDQEADMYGSIKPEGATFEQYCANTEPPVLTYQAHSSPIGMIYYTATGFPEDYQGDAFIVFRGSWNRAPATGYEVVRVDFEDGQAVATEPFISGWLINDGTAHFGRLAGIAVAEDGSMFISDDTNGVVYKITYAG